MLNVYNFLKPERNFRNPRTEIRRAADRDGAAASPTSDKPLRGRRGRTESRRRSAPECSPSARLGGRSARPPRPSASRAPATAELSIIGTYLLRVNGFSFLEKVRARGSPLIGRNANRRDFLKPALSLFSAVSQSFSLSRVCCLET